MRNLVHGVGAQDDAFRPCSLQGSRCLSQYLSRLIPRCGTLQALDLGKVDAVENEPCGMQSAETLPYCLIDNAIVRNGGFPTHPAKQANRFQYSLSCQIPN